jgi:hypothetical protein
VISPQLLDGTGSRLSSDAAAAQEVLPAVRARYPAVQSPA